jgi:hypothetical protein
MHVLQAARSSESLDCLLVSTGCCCCCQSVQCAWHVTDVMMWWCVVQVLQSCLPKERQCWRLQVGAVKGRRPWAMPAPAAPAAPAEPFCIPAATESQQQTPGRKQLLAEMLRLREHVASLENLAGDMGAVKGAGLGTVQVRVSGAMSHNLFEVWVGTAHSNTQSAFPGLPLTHRFGSYPQ